MVALGGGTVSYQRGTPIPAGDHRTTPIPELRLYSGFIPGFSTPNFGFISAFLAADFDPLNPLHLQREFFIGHLLVRIYFIIELFRRTGLAP